MYFFLHETPDFFKLFFLCCVAQTLPPVLTAEVASRLCLVLPESLFKRVYLSVLDADDEGAAGAAGIACAKGHDGVLAMNAIQRGIYLKMQVEP
jgi:hypothetical protein